MSCGRLHVHVYRWQRTFDHVKNNGHRRKEERRQTVANQSGSDWKQNGDEDGYGDNDGVGIHEGGNVVDETSELVADS